MSGSLDDHQQIRELYARYAYSLDHGDIDRMMDCFTDDAVFESARQGRFEGCDGLRKFAGSIPERTGGAQIRHLITNQLCDLDGDRGTGSCYFMYFHCKNNQVQQVTVGEYNDELRKVDGRWKIRSRKVILLGHR